MTIREIQEAVSKKLFSYLELTQDKLKTAKKNQNGEYITVCEDLALNAAKKADEMRSRQGNQAVEENPLLGIPLAIKDLIAVKGVRNTCGSKILQDYVPPYSATVIERLSGAGAVVIGKTNLDEFGMGSSNENSAFGPVLVPKTTDRVAGGSSGGSAAALVSESCLGALGTDTGGSIRLPASFCGVVGIKPTYGRVSRFGQVAFASSLDQIGPMANTVQDAALLLDLISGYDPMDSTSAPMPPTQCHLACGRSPSWKDLKVGIPEEYFKQGLDPQVEKAIRGVLRWLEKKGARCIPVELPHSRYAISVYYLVAVSEASSNLARYDAVRFGTRAVPAEASRNLSNFYEKNRSFFGDEVKRRILLGTFALSAGYADAYFKKASQVRRKIKTDFENAFKQVDFILGPVSSSTAFRIGEKVDDPLQMYLNDIYTIPVNLAGLPAMSLPCGKNDQGLSIGLHLIAPPFEEERMVSLAAAIQAQAVQGDFS